MSIPAAPTTQERAGQKAAVTFGNLADIGTALRAARKARREDSEPPTEARQSTLFDL